MFKVMSILPPQDPDDVGNYDWVELILHECTSYDEAFKEWELAVNDFKSLDLFDPRGEIILYSTDPGSWELGLQWAWSYDNASDDNGDPIDELEEVLVASGYFPYVDIDGTQKRRYVSWRMQKAEVELIYRTFVNRHAFTIET